MSRYTLVLSDPVHVALERVRARESERIGAKRLSWDSLLSMLAKRLRDKPPRAKFEPAKGLEPKNAIALSKETRDELAELRERESARLGKKLTWDGFLGFVAKTQEKA